MCYRTLIACYHVFLVSYLITFKLNDMLRAAIWLFIIAVIAGILGFTGIAAAAAGIAKIVFYIFLVLAFISILGYLVTGRAPRL